MPFLPLPPVELIAAPSVFSSFTFFPFFWNVVCWFFLVTGIDPPMSIEGNVGYCDAQDRIGIAFEVYPGSRVFTPSLRDRLVRSCEYPPLYTANYFPLSEQLVMDRWCLCANQHELLKEQRSIYPSDSAYYDKQIKHLEQKVHLFYLLHRIATSGTDQFHTRECLREYREAVGDANFYSGYVPN